MKASFYEYNVAMSGLVTARANLNVVFHNVTNAEIPGYSRQYTLQKAATPLTLRDGRGAYGMGSEVYGIMQMRDIYLDRKYWHQNGILGEYTTKTTQLTLLEIVFNDLPETAPGKGPGLQTAFSSFFDKLQELSRPEGIPDGTFRTNVTSAAETLTHLVRTNAEIIMKQQRDINQEIEGMVSRINALGTQIANLNKQIQQSEFDGSHANDLRDQRARLVDDLSQYVNVQVEELDYSSEDIPYDKRYVVLIDGHDFINNNRIHTFVCVPRDFASNVTTTGGYPLPPDGKINTKRNEMDVPGLFDLYFADTGAEFNIYSDTLKGSLKGLVDVRDGNNSVPTEYDAETGEGLQTTNFKGIPFYMNKLNQLVRIVARAFNEGLDRDAEPIDGVTGHLYGYNKYGFETGQPCGELFFTKADGKEAYRIDDFGTTLLNGKTVTDYSALNCLNFSINPALVDDPYLLATSSDYTKGESHNDMVLGFCTVSSYPSLFREGKILDFIISLTGGHLAIDNMQAQKFELSYSEITVMTNYQRKSISNVDINEEMVNMMKYQQLYQACAKLVNVIDRIYDTLINRLGA